MNTEEQIDDNDPIEGIGAMISEHIKKLSQVEGPIKFVKKIGNSFYITFNNGTRYAQPLAFKYDSQVTFDTCA